MDVCQSEIGPFWARSFNTGKPRHNLEEFLVWTHARFSEMAEGSLATWDCSTFVSGIRTLPEAWLHASRLPY